MSEFWVFFNILNEHLIIFFVALSTILFFTASSFGIFIIFCYLFKMFKFPKTVFLSTTEFRVSFLNKNYWRNKRGFIIFHFIKLHQVNGIKIKSKDSVIVIESLAKMSIYNECSIIPTEVLSASYFYLYHLKSLFSCSSAYVYFIICIFNVKNYEFS